MTMQAFLLAPLNLTKQINDYRQQKHKKFDIFKRTTKWNFLWKLMTPPLSKFKIRGPLVEDYYHGNWWKKTLLGFFIKSGWLNHVGRKIKHVGQKRLS